MVGFEFQGPEMRAELAEYWPLHQNGKQVGHVTDAIWSPRLEQNIGYVWVPTEFSRPGTELVVHSPDGMIGGRTAAIPFIDRKKSVPAG